MNRSDITDRFGVSNPQASNDLSQYQRLAPDNLRYDPSLKRYVPADGFRPLFFTPHALRYLTDLRSIVDHALAPSEAWAGAASNVAVMPVPGRRVGPEILRVLLKAIRESKSIEVHYHSMSDSQPNAAWRHITPHAFGHDGLRWHTRAYCHTDHRFKDFVLSRFLEMGALGDSGAKGSADMDWHTEFNVVLQANPALGAEKARTVELDYEMTDGKLVLSVRRALLYYLDKRLRLDVGERLDKPHETPVVVGNRVEFEMAIKNAAGLVATG